MTIQIAELNADAKRVYNTGVNGLVELADKYNVTTTSLTYAKANPSDTFASLGYQAFGTKSATKEIQRVLYGTIKGLIAKA